jgi:cell division protein FtsI (penicillin-binding protein 3)
MPPRGQGGRRGVRPSAPVRSAQRIRRRRGSGVCGDAVDGRIRLVRILFVVVFLLVGGKAIALAAAPGRLAALALRQQTRQVELPAPRGTILDRTGQVLAVSQAAQTVYATPYLLKDPGVAALSLARTLHITGKGKFAALVRALSDHTSGFAYVARKVDPSLARRALTLHIPGVGSYREEKRVYPMGASGAQLVGFAGTDNRGLTGIEYSQDRAISGRSGSEVIVCDPEGQALRVVRGQSPVPGQDVQLTIDQDIQLNTEQVLLSAVKAYQAKGAEAIVMDPRTGHIYAMANVPLVKDRRFGVKPDTDRDRAVTDAYEPGSIFKLITISGALADHIVSPTTRFTLGPTIRVADRTIHEAEAVAGTRHYSVREIIRYSSNVGAVTIGKLMGQAEMLKWIDRFGFGHTTGVDFPGESSGFVPRTWSGSTIGNIPMGQGITVTPLQMVCAFAAVADGGVWVRPSLIAQVGTRVTPPGLRRRVVPRVIAREVLSMLTDAVNLPGGTGTRASMKDLGYLVAGKTGTAQKPLPNGKGYSTSAYVGSFVGIVPAGHPRLVVIVVFDEPHPIWGGYTAAPTFKKIAAFALQHLEIAP